MTFDTHINGIPCQCSVLEYTKGAPSTFSRGAWQPGEQEEFDYEILDRRGRRARWLDRYLDSATDIRLRDEAVMKMAEYYTEPDYAE